MGFFDGFAEGLAAAVDDIRHNVVEIPMYNREVTGNIELPQVEAPKIEPASSGVIDLTSASTSASWGVSGDTIQAQSIEAPQIEPPAPSQDMER